MSVLLLLISGLVLIYFGVGGAKAAMVSARLRQDRTGFLDQGR